MKSKSKYSAAGINLGIVGDSHAFGVKGMVGDSHAFGVT